MTPQPGQKEITQFVGAHGFLSNFYMYPFSYALWLWPSAEHAYQAAKTANEVSKAAIRNAKTATQAKAIGQHVVRVPNFDAQRVRIMSEILRCKFRRGNRMARLLLLTGDAFLREGNHWGDTFWGQVRLGVRWQGENHLGLILMEIRKELLLPEQPTLFEPQASKTRLQREADEDDTCPV